MRPRLLVVLFALSTACGRDSASRSAPPPSVPSPASPSQSQAATLTPNVSPEEQTSARKTVELFLAGFRHAGEHGDAEVRVITYKLLRDSALAAASSIDTSEYRPMLHPRAGEILDEIAELDAADAKDAEGSAELPAKPQHEPPTYEGGAFHVTGAVKRCYQDGVALKAGGKYYFVRDADCPVFNTLSGYVEDTLETVDLDIGRDGREAMIVTISDRETADDDRREFQQALKEYEADYKLKLAAYKDAAAKNQPLAKAREEEGKTRQLRRQGLLTELERILLPLSQGKPVPGTTSTATANVVAVIDPPPSASAVKVEGVPERAPSASRRSHQANNVASKKDRGACMRRCVAICADDPGCERSCATQKCM